ncbi:ABC transporter ATP-binding protein, partial [Campylobacter jejuni]
GLEAKIKETSLLGNIIRYRVRVQEIEFKVDTLNFSTHSTYEVGDKIALKFNLSLAIKI